MKPQLTKPDKQPEVVQQLIEQAKLFSEKFYDYRKAFYEYDELKNPRTPSMEEFIKTGCTKPKNNTKQQKAKLPILLKAVHQARQETFKHSFLQMPHKEPNYQQAFH